VRSDGCKPRNEPSEVRKPSDLLKPGETVEVVILGVNAGEQRMSLGLKQALGDPWVDAAQKFLGIFGLDMRGYSLMGCDVQDNIEPRAQRQLITCAVDLHMSSRMSSRVPRCPRCVSGTDAG